MAALAETVWNGNTLRSADRLIDSAAGMNLFHLVTFLTAFGSTKGGRLCRQRRRPERWRIASWIGTDPVGRGHIEWSVEETMIFRPIFR